MNSVFLSIGSNKGDRENFIVCALRLLRIGGKIMEVSSVYETASLLRDSQPYYLNIVCRIETELSAQNLLEMIHDIEDSLGRDRTVKIWGERTIDIDIIDFDSIILDEHDLILPHKEMAFRSFVLYPLKEICPDYINPMSKISISDMISNLRDDLGIKNIGQLKGFQ